MPDGQISKLPVQPSSQKFSILLVGQIIDTSLRHPVLRRGALAIVTNVGMGCGGRGSVRHAAELQGGSYGVVSENPACRRTALNPPSLKLRRTGTKPVEAFGIDGCGRQSRVVLAPVAGVKLAEVHEPNRAQ
jgi:hypothetical protein